MSENKLIFLYTLVFALFASATEQIPANIKLQPLAQVEWYKPETSESKIPNKAQVLLSGKTLPGSKIKLSGDEFCLLI